MLLISSFVPNGGFAASAESNVTNIDLTEVENIFSNYDTGWVPTVTVLENGDLLEVYEGIGNALLYNLGRYEDGEINWFSGDTWKL